MTGLIVLLVVLALATAFALWRRSVEGRMRDAVPEPVSGDEGPVDVETPDRAHHGGESLTGEQIGSALGARATLVQFSSSFCQPCRAASVVLADVAGAMSGVAHVEVDAASHMDLVRHLDVRRTPTVFLLDARGVIRKRAVGLPREADVVAALAEFV